MEFIDSHCHINDKQFNEDLEDVVYNAIEKNNIIIKDISEAIKSI